jgi:hypothetical protein
MNIKYYPTVWLLWCNDRASRDVAIKDKQGVYLEELFAHKIEAEAYLRECKERDKYGIYWIQEKNVFNEGGTA